MNTTHLRTTLFSAIYRKAGLILFLCCFFNTSNAQFTIYTEGTDLNDLLGPNNTYTLSSAGTHTISGTVTSPGDQQDGWYIQVASGFQITTVTNTTGTNANSGTYFYQFGGLGAGNFNVLGSNINVSLSGFYTGNVVTNSDGAQVCLINANNTTGALSWSVTYTVTTVASAPSITTNPSSASVCSGAATSFTVAASNSPTSYLWQVNNGGGYANISNGGVYSNATTATLNISSSTGLNGYLYRARATNGTGSSSFSSAATLTVNSAPAITTSPSNASVCSGAATSFTVAANNTPTGYTWQLSTNSGGSWSNISNGGVYTTATTATLNISSSTGLGGNQYRALATNSCGTSSASTAATLTVNPAPSITTDPSNSSVCNGAATSFTVVANNSPTGYTWQLSTNSGGSWSNISNGGVYTTATTATLNISSTTGLGGNQYRALATNACGTSSASAAATLTANSTPSVTTNPSNASTCSNTGTSFTVAASNSPTSYIWQVNNGGGYVNISNGGIYSTATTATLNISSTAGLNGYLYRAIANNGCGSSSASTGATLTVTPTVGTPVFTLGSSSTRCQGAGTVTYSATASNNTSISYVLDGTTLGFAGNSFNSSTGAVTYAAGWSGTSTIIAQAFGCGGVSTLSFHTVTTTPPVGTPAFTLGATSTRCQGAGTTTYGATASNNTGITYSLDATTLAFAGNSIVAGTGAVTFAAGWSGTSTITASAAGCNGPSTATHTVTITPTVGTPVFTLGATSTRCQGAGTVTYGATATNNTGITYSLDATTLAFAGNSIVAGTGAVTYAAGWSGTSTITASAAGCNGPSTATHTVTITPTVGTPVFTLGATSTRCQGAGTVTYGATATNNTGITYSLDATTLAFAGNSIVAGTGAVTYAAGWTGTSTITATATGCNGPSTATHTVTTTQTVGTPVFTLGATSTRCQGAGTVTYGATAANTTGITYTLDATTLAFAGNSIVAGTGAVTYAAGWSGTSTITASAAGCNGPSTATHTVTITPTVGTPVFTLGATSTRCQGAGTVTYGATATNNTGITYSLDATTLAFAGNSIVAGTGAVTYAAGWSGTSTITASAAGCNGPSTATHTVTITPTVGTPVFTLGATSTRCQGAGTVTYGATATNNTGITYSLDATTLAFAGNSIVAGTGAVTYATGWTGTSTITATATGCNGPSSATHTVTITSTIGTPVFTLGATSTRCQGAGTVTYGASSTGSTGITYTLDATTLAFAGNSIVAGTGAVTYAAGWSGTSTITASAAGCNGPTTATHTVTITPTVGTPVFTLGATSTRCQGAGTVTYGATATNNTGITYSLDATTLAFAGNSIVAGTGAVTYAAGWSGTSTITASAAGCNGPSTATHTVTITPTVGTPVFTLGATSTRCQGAGTVTYGATATNNTGITYSLDATTLAFAGNSIVAGTGAVTYAAGWTGTSTITATATGCNGPSTATHTVTTTQTVSTPVFTLGATSTRCQGAGTVTYGATAANTTGITYTLDATTLAFAGNSIVAGTGAVTYAAGWSGTSTITASAAGCNGPSTATHTVTITPTVGTPVFTLGATSSRCQGAGTVTYGATSTNNTGITYSLDATTLAFAGNSIVAGTGAVTFASGWSGTSTITASAAGCNGPATATHTVITNAPPAISLNPSNTITCAGSNTNFTVSATGGGLVYQWQEDLGGGFANLTNGVLYSGTSTNSMTITNTPPTLTTAQYRCFVSGTCAPTTTSTAATLTVNLLPAVTSQPANSAVCPGTNTGFSLTATGTAIAYQWQENTGSGFANVTNGGIYSFATSNSLAIANPSLSMNGYTYRCMVTGACTPPVFTNVVTLTVNTPTTVVSQPVSGSVCENNTTTFSVGVTGGGLVYRWQVDQGSGFTNLANNTNYSGVHTSSLSVVNAPLTFSGYQYRCYIIGNCTPLTINSNSATLTVTPMPFITLNPANTATCIGNNAAFSVTAGGAGLSYQWQLSTNAGGTWSNLVSGAPYSNVTAATMNITAATLSMNGYQYRCVVNGTCSPAAITTAATLTIDSPPAITSNPVDNTTCFGTNTSFTVVATGAGLTYQWQLSSNGGTTWGNLTNTAPYSTVNAATLTITGATSAINSFQYRCVVSGNCPPSATSTPAILTVTPLVAITSQPPVSQFVCSGSNISLSITATSATSYQWQFDGGSGFTALSNNATYAGVTTATLSITSTSNATNGTYRCVVGSVCSAPTASNTSVLNVYLPTNITTQPSSTTSCVATNSYFTVNATGSSLVYQWQVSTNGGTTWNNLANAAPYGGVNANQLTIFSTTFSLNGFQYRCFVNGACASTATSNAATLSVTQLTAITTHPPSSSTVCIGSATSLSITASNATIYQWQLDQGSGFANVLNVAPYSGANTATLSISSASLATNGTYRCMASNACAPPVSSNSSVLNVFAPIVITTQPASATFCANGNSYFSVTATGGGLTYQWQLSTNGGTTWSNLTNTAPYSAVTSNQLTISNTPSALNTFQYRCVVTSGCSSTTITNAAILTVTPLVTIATQPVVSQFVCAGSATSMTCVAANATAFQWQLDQGSGFVNVPNSAPYSGVTTATLSISSASAATNGTYRCMCSNACFSTPTNSSVLNVYLVTTITTQPTSLTNCSGVNSYFTVNANGSSLVYQWQLSTNGGTTWNNLTNAAPYSAVTSNILTISATPASLNTYQYRCVVTGSCASIATSNAAILTVNTPPVVTANPVNVITCLGTNASYSVTATGSSISYKWQVYNNITWTNVVDNAIYSNSATATLNLTGVTATMNGYAYRCVVTGICPNNPAISNQASLTVNMPPAVTVNPVNQVICLGTNTSYSVSATGTAPITYQWQADQGSGFVNISNGTNYIGVTTNTLNVNFAPLTFNGYKYRCAVNGLCAPPANSGFGTITINDTATVVSVPFTDTLCEGDSSLFAVNLGGPVTSLQWQESNGAGGFIDLPTGTPPYIGVNGPVLKLNPVTKSLYGKSYRCKVTSSCNTVYSEVFSVIVYGVANITVNPLDLTVPAGLDATFHVEGSDTDHIYYWQASSDTGNTFSNIYNNNMYSGVQTKTLTVLKVNAAENGWLFRCITKDNKKYCYKQYDTSSLAKLTVGAPIPFPVNVANTTINLGKFSVYPNPVHGNQLMIKTENAQIKSVHYRIIDQFGRAIQDENLTLSQANNAPINVENLISGVYTIQFYDEKHAVNQSIRFTKEQ